MNFNCLFYCTGYSSGLLANLLQSSIGMGSYTLPFQKKIMPWITECYYTSHYTDANSTVAKHSLHQWAAFCIVESFCKLCIYFKTKHKIHPQSSMLIILGRGPCQVLSRHRKPIIKINASYHVFYFLKSYFWRELPSVPFRTIGFGVGALCSASYGSHV